MPTRCEGRGRSGYVRDGLKPSTASSSSTVLRASSNGAFLRCPILSLSTVTPTSARAYHNSASTSISNEHLPVQTPVRSQFSQFVANCLLCESPARCSTVLAIAQISPAVPSPTPPQSEAFVLLWVFLIPFQRACVVLEYRAHQLYAPGNGFLLRRDKLRKS